MKKDSLSDDELSQSDSESTMKRYASSSKKCVQFRVRGSNVQIPSKYIERHGLNLPKVAHENICQIYQKKTSKDKVKLAGSGIIVALHLESQIKLQHPRNNEAHYVVGLVLSCAHLDLSLSKPIYMTTKQSIPQNDLYQIVPIFKQDFTTRVDNYIDPATGAPLPANDVNLFFIVIPLDFLENDKEELRKVAPKLQFLPQNEIHPGLKVYLGAYSDAVQNLPSQQLLPLYELTPSCTFQYLQAKKKFLKKNDTESKLLYLSFEKKWKYSQIFHQNKGFYKGYIQMMNEELAACTYSCMQGTSGGPILYHDGTEARIVGVNHGSAGVGDFSLQKVYELCKEQLMFPKDLRFSFSFIASRVLKYYSKMTKFKKHEKPNQCQTSKMMNLTLNLFFNSLSFLIQSMAGLKSKFFDGQDQIYQQFNQIYGAVEKNANYSIATIGGERFQKIKDICNNFESLIENSSSAQCFKLKEVQNFFGWSKEYINFRSFLVKRGRFIIKKEFSNTIKNSAKKMLEIQLQACLQKKQENKFLQNFLELQQMFNQNAETLYKCFLVQKLNNIFTQMMKISQMELFVRDQVVNLLKKLLSEKTSNLIENLQENKELNSEESKLNILIDSIGIVEDSDYDYFQRLFFKAVQTIKFGQFPDQAKLYDSNEEVLELLHYILQMDGDRLELQDQQSKIYILRELKRILSLGSKERGLLIENLEFTRIACIRESKTHLKLGKKQRKSNKLEEANYMNLINERNPKKKKRTI